MEQEENKYCPKCIRIDTVKPKLIMIGKALSEESQFRRENSEGFIQVDTLTADQLKDEAFLDFSKKQFVSGFYCDNCKLGFIPLSYLKEM